MLRLLPGIFGLGRCLLVDWLLFANGTLSGWHSFSFSILLSVCCKGKLEWRQSRFPLSLFLWNTTVALFTTCIALPCGFALSNSFRRPWWCGRTMYGVFHGTASPSSSGHTSRSRPFMTSEGGVSGEVLWCRTPWIIGGGACCFSVIWSPSGRCVSFWARGCGPIELSLLKETNTKLQWNCNSGRWRVPLI